MNPAEMPSRRKICSKVRRTEVGPAPDGPVTAVIGCLADMLLRPPVGVRSEQATRSEERRIVFKLVVVAVIPLDALDLVAGPEHESNPLVRSLRLHLEDGLVARTGAAAGLFDEKADRVGLVQQ